MSPLRTYQLATSVAFRKTTDDFGGLSNMAGGYHLCINDIIVPSSEHLYQACKFPSYPKIQLDIISEPSPMKAKWISRRHNILIRKDWDKVKFKVMKWALEVKLSQNWTKFSALLAETENKPIVELTNNDKVWGARLNGDVLTGINALGRLLMEIRENNVYHEKDNQCVEPLEIPDFEFLGVPIGLICNEQYIIENKFCLQEIA